LVIRGLVGKQMSSSNESTKIDLLENEKTVDRKIRNAEFVEGNTENGVMALLKYFIFVIKQDKREKFQIKRDKKYGGDVSYNSYGELEKDVVEKKIHPLDVKNALAREINLVLKKVQTPKLRKLHNDAYG
jgi:tyrosyl-tRNA synthetase